MTPFDVVRGLLALILDLVSHTDAKLLLDEEARKRGELVADAAEDMKFPR